MKLIYHDETQGRNFGDLLNGPIFQKYLPDFFDQDESESLLGIGSILGLDFAKVPGRKIVFSSGFAYGEKPSIDSSYEFSCVRGPLTAKTLGLDSSLAVADGAYLIRGLVEEFPNKDIECSMMMHWHSLEKYDWRPISERLGINFIDPKDNIEKILDQLLRSKLVLAEAMHAAIVADALRIPWLPIRGYRGVNEFKWRDFMGAVELDYEPVDIGSLYANTQYTQSIVKNKTKELVNTSSFPFRAVFSLYEKYQSIGPLAKVLDNLKELKGRAGILSADKVWDNKFNELLRRLEQVKSIKSNN